MKKTFFVSALAFAVVLALTYILVPSSPLSPVVQAESNDDDDIVRVEQMNSPQFGLPDQTFQNTTFTVPIKTSLVVVNDRGGTGHRSFLVNLSVASGGSIPFSVREGLADVTLPLTRPISLSGVQIRCGSFSSVNCQYTVTLVGH